MKDRPNPNLLAESQQHYARDALSTRWSKLTLLPSRGSVSDVPPIRSECRERRNPVYAASVLPSDSRRGQPDKEQGAQQKTLLGNRKDLRTYKRQQLLHEERTCPRRQRSLEP